MTKIDVTQYMLGDDGVAVLMKAIAAVTTLTTLDLRDNLIGTHSEKCSLWEALHRKSLGP